MSSTVVMISDRPIVSMAPMIESCDTPVSSSAMPSASCMRVTGVKPPQRFPRNLRVVKSEMTGKLFTQLPVDLKAPRLHSRSEMNMEMEVNGPGGLRVSMRRASTLISKTTPLPAKP